MEDSNCIFRVETAGLAAFGLLLLLQLLPRLLSLLDSYLSSLFMFLSQQLLGQLGEELLPLHPNSFGKFVQPAVGNS